MKLLKDIFESLLESLRDLLPIILVITFFQLTVLQQPIPNFGEIARGIVFVVVGLSLFIYGLNMGLFPIGEAMAYAFASKGSLLWLLLFAFALGFGTTVAEPALIAVAMSVGFAIVLGVFRIIKGWPIQYLMIGGYIGVMIMTIFAPEEIVGIAYDSGGVTTSTITVPLVTALGVGLASSIKGRNPMIDGFGLIAFASLTPIIFVMAYGMVV